MSLLIIATIVTLVFNADALQVGRAVWNDDAVRAAVIAQAQSSVETGQGPRNQAEGASQSAKDLAQEAADVRSLELTLGGAPIRTIHAGSTPRPAASARSWGCSP